MTGRQDEVSVVAYPVWFTTDGEPVYPGDPRREAVRKKFTSVWLSAQEAQLEAGILEVAETVKAEHGAECDCTWCCAVASVGVRAQLAIAYLNVCEKQGLNPFSGTP